MYGAHVVVNLFCSEHLILVGLRHSPVANSSLVPVEDTVPLPQALLHVHAEHNHAKAATANGGPDAGTSGMPPCCLVSRLAELCEMGLASGKCNHVLSHRDSPPACCSCNMVDLHLAIAGLNPKLDCVHCCHDSQIHLHSYICNCRLSRMVVCESIWCPS